MKFLLACALYELKNTTEANEIFYELLSESKAEIVSLRKKHGSARPKDSQSSAGLG